MWWTLAASLLASGTALFISLVLYPRQKEIDRILQMAQEKRAFYVKLVEALSDLDEATWGHEIAEGFVPNVPSRISASLHLYASPEIIDAFYNEVRLRHELMLYYKDHDWSCPRRDYSEVAEEFLAAQGALLRALRNDVTGEAVDTEVFESIEAKSAFYQMPRQP